MRHVRQLELRHRGREPERRRTCADNGGRPGRVWETQGVGTARTAASMTGNDPQARIPGPTCACVSFDSWINGGHHKPIRWHWDRVAVNPHDDAGNLAPPSAAPSFCLGAPNNTCPDTNY